MQRMKTNEESDKFKFMQIKKREKKKFHKNAKTFRYASLPPNYSFIKDKFLSYFTVRNAVYSKCVDMKKKFKILQNNKISFRANTAISVA